MLLIYGLQLKRTFVTPVSVPKSNRSFLTSPVRTNNNNYNVVKVKRTMSRGIYIITVTTNVLMHLSKKQEIPYIRSW